MSPSAKNTRKSSSSSSAARRAMTAAVLATSALSAGAFSPSTMSGGPSSGTTALFSSQPEHGRREMLSKSFGAAMGILASGVVVAGSPEEASATYSAYANREKDWEERSKNGEVSFSTARDLRAQMRDLVPQNSESSRVFCPNGPSAAVSPLMENKCGDKLAMPSVYGRTSDVTGNSIPGFAGGKYAPIGGGTITVGGTGGVARESGGFPAYKPY